MIPDVLPGQLIFIQTGKVETGDGGFLKIPRP